MKLAQPYQLLFLSILFFSSGTLFGQKVSELDFQKLAEANKLKTINRTLTLSHDSDYKSTIHLDEKPGVGIVWLGKTKFSGGILDFDVKGRDVMQQSFVGIAFHGLNDSTYDAVYFRPFNFRSADSARRSHAVQYISMPLYDWPKLRSEEPGKYEDSIYAAPLPNNWFHVSIVVQNTTISVYVNRNLKASLVIEKLNDRSNGLIGFWVGNGSDGDFANLKLTEID